MNNGVLGMVRQWQTLFFNKHYSNTILDRETDFVALAHAFSCDGPYVIDCRIDKDEFVLPMLPPGGSMDDIIMKVGE